MRSDDLDDDIDDSDDPNDARVSLQEERRARRKKCGIIGH